MRGGTALGICFILLCRVAAAGGGGWEKSEQVNTTQGFYTLTGLQPGAQYHLKVVHGNSTHWEGEAKTVEPRKYAEFVFLSLIKVSVV